MEKPLRIGLASDHAGYLFKSSLIEFLESEGHKVQDFGTNGPDSVDYPDYVHPLCDAIESEDLDYGVLICGSANGVCMTANKHEGIRAAICSNDELAALAKQHNNANVICFAERFSELEETKTRLKIFIETPFEGGRHARRVGKIALPTATKES